MVLAISGRRKRMVKAKDDCLATATTKIHDLFFPITAQIIPDAGNQSSVTTCWGAPVDVTPLVLSGQEMLQMNNDKG
jgi:hypothetical protein